MAINNAFQPDNGNNTPPIAVTATNSTDTRLNENTTQLDTYFSDAKIKIPQKVSFSQ